MKINMLKKTISTEIYDLAKEIKRLKLTEYKTDAVKEAIRHKTRQLKVLESLEPFAPEKPLYKEGPEDEICGFSFRKRMTNPIKSSSKKYKL